MFFFQKASKLLKTDEMPCGASLDPTWKAILGDAAHEVNRDPMPTSQRQLTLGPCSSSCALVPKAYDVVRTFRDQSRVQIDDLAKERRPIRSSPLTAREMGTCFPHSSHERVGPLYGVDGGMSEFLL